jgi:hypothetical protein
MFSPPRTLLAIASSALALAFAAPASAASFTITIDDGGACQGTWQTTGNAVSPTVTCVTDGTPPPPPSGPTCSPLGTFAIQAGNSQNLTANCSLPSGSSGTLSYVWHTGSSVGPSFGGNTAAVSVTPAATTTYWVVATDSSTGLSAQASGLVTVTTPTPTTGNCSSYSTINLGDLAFNGTQTDSNGMRAGVVAYGRIVIPNPLPTGWYGKTTSLSVFEYGSGSVWKKVYLSKTPCDFPTGIGSWSQGINTNLYMTFGTQGFLSTSVQPGDIWYVMVKDEALYGTTASCAPGTNCNFSLRLYPPSSN